LEELPDPKFVETEFGDGDSFMVKSGRKSYVFRLYFVDCPETVVSSNNDHARLLEQARHFGVEDRRVVKAYGEQAAKRVIELLRANNFTVHTSFASALGRSAKPRYYAFITLADGSDLAATLISEGLARAKGVKRASPDGISAVDIEALLEDLELSAAIGRKGLWSKSDPEKIVELRRQQREFEQLTKQSPFSTITEDNPVNLNTAEMELLQEIQGIGPTIAERIVDGRPYERIEDLERVKGIGPETISRAARFLTVK
jgi:competence protein ComEA